MGERIRSLDWAATLLGPTEGWPEALRTALQLVLDTPQPAGLCIGQNSLLLYNDGYRALLGGKHPAALGEPLAEVWSELAEAVVPAIAAVMAGQPQLWEDAPFQVAGRGDELTTAWFTASWTPVRVGGEVGGFIILATEATPRHLADVALRESEERLRLIVENACDYAIFTIDPEGTIDQWYPGAAAVYGWSAEEARGMALEETFTHEDRANAEPQKELEQAAREGTAPNVRWHLRKGGELVFIDGINTALRNAEGELLGFLKIGQDVTARNRADEHQRMLLGELQHRVRNTLAVIRSIARRTAATTDTVEEMSSHLAGRIDAFARVQAAVTRNPDGGVDLTSLVEDELLAYAAREGERIQIAGPELALKARPAETLSLAIHELATNAVKYGVLVGESGMLAVRWRRDLTGGDERLELVWEESGLEGIDTDPERQGFGLELLTRTLPYELRAESNIEFRPQGLRFTLSMPLGPDVLSH